MGIEETQKLIAVVTEDILKLFEVDFEKVFAEMDELDVMEKLRFWASIGEGAVKILLAAQRYGLKQSLEMHSAKV